MTIKLKTVNFEVKSRGVTVPTPVSKSGELYRLAAELLQQEVGASGGALRLRLMGNVIWSLTFTLHLLLLREQPGYHDVKHVNPIVNLNHTISLYEVSLYTDVIVHCRYQDIYLSRF